jgi:hypothetical protein
MPDHNEASAKQPSASQALLSSEAVAPLAQQQVKNQDDSHDTHHDSPNNYHAAHLRMRSSSEPPVSAKGAAARNPSVTDEEVWKLLKQHPTVADQLETQLYGRVKFVTIDLKYLCYKFFLEMKDKTRKWLHDGCPWAEVEESLQKSIQEHLALIDVREAIHNPPPGRYTRYIEAVKDGKIKPLVSAKDWYRTEALEQVSVDVDPPKFQLRMCAPFHENNGLALLLIGDHWEKSRMGKAKTWYGHKYWRVGDMKHVPLPDHMHITLVRCPGNVKCLIRAYKHLQERKRALFAAWLCSNEHLVHLLLPAGPHESEPAKSQQFLDLCNTNCDNRLITVAWAMNEKGIINANSYEIVERRIVFLRYGSSAGSTEDDIPPDVYVDLEGREVKPDANDVVLPETEDTYKALAEFYNNVDEGDLEEEDGLDEVDGGDDQAAAAPDIIHQEQEDNHGGNTGKHGTQASSESCHPSKKAKY